jgi:hypothetical protein
LYDIFSIRAFVLKRGMLINKNNQSYFMLLKILFQLIHRKTGNKEKIEGSTLVDQVSQAAFYYFFFTGLIENSCVVFRR